MPRDKCRCECRVRTLYTTSLHTILLAQRTDRVDVSMAADSMAGIYGDSADAAWHRTDSSASDIMNASIYSAANNQTSSVTQLNKIAVCDCTVYRRHTTIHRAITNSCRKAHVAYYCRISAQNTSHCGIVCSGRQESPPCAPARI